ncbi:hypothetical protein IJI31_00995 [bacterium]|nr:hypothetical protein [bacterium]
MEQYNTLKNKIQSEKQELREYQLFDSHYGLNDMKIQDLNQRILVHQKNLHILLDSNVKDVPKLNLMV